MDESTEVASGEALPVRAASKWRSQAPGGDSMDEKRSTTRRTRREALRTGLLLSAAALAAACAPAASSPSKPAEPAKPAEAAKPAAPAAEPAKPADASKPAAAPAAKTGGPAGTVIAGLGRDYLAYPDVKGTIQFSNCWGGARI